MPTDDRPLAKNGDKPERHITHTHTYITHTQRGSPWGVHAYAKDADADADEEEDEFESVWVTLIRALRTPLTLRSAFEIGSTLDLVCHLGVIIAPDQESIRSKVAQRSKEIAKQWAKENWQEPKFRGQHLHTIGAKVMTETNKAALSEKFFQIPH